MKQPFRLPFSNLGPREWQNLALAGLAAFYLLLTALTYIDHSFCELMACDYCAFWSAGKVAGEYGYANVYRLELLIPIQQANIQGQTASLNYNGIPVPYFSLFLIPFQVLANLPVTGGFWLWTLLNLSGVILYLLAFYRSVSGMRMPTRLLIMLLLSFQFFMNFYLGQVNVFLLICTGEFARSLLSGRSFRAGLWLGGLLVKPQLLILILPYLLYKRWWRALSGFGTAALVTLFFSLVLAGPQGISNQVSLLLGYSRGVENVAVNIMMNWRMLGAALAGLLGPAAGWITAALGMIITLLILIVVLSRAQENDPAGFALKLLAIFATTCAITWHSHLSMSMVFVPFFLILHARGLLPERILTGWVFLPASIWFAQSIAGALIASRILPAASIAWMNFLYGIVGLGLNLYLLSFAAKHRHSSQISHS